MEIKLKGKKELQKRLKTIEGLRAGKEIVRVNTSELQNQAVREAVFVGGYSKGTTRRSIEPEIRDGGLTGSVQPTTDWAPYLEYGTRFMDSQPFMKPSFTFQKVKFLKDIERLMK